MTSKIALPWTVGHAPDSSTRPQEFVPAQVPGAVQLDWARAHDWPDHNYADNFRAYEWMEDRFWVYQTELSPPQIENDEQLFFVCKGIDYQYQVRLNGEVLYAHEGMFKPFEIDLTGRAQNGDTLEIVVFPVPKSCPEPTRVQANQSCKPAVSYLWDFHPRLVPLGIWDETFLEVRPAQHIQSIDTQSALTNEYSIAEITASCAVSDAENCLVEWSLHDPTGIEVLAAVLVVDATIEGNGFFCRATLEHPQLWWPSGEGAQPLYTSRFELTRDGETIDQKTALIGFRDVQLVMHPTAWDKPSGFPKSRSTPPITLQINGRRIFAKGSNWVAPAIFPGQITRDLYDSLLQLVQQSNMNILRCWGGAIVNKDAFFEICDERGILVWQEFPLACNRYEGTPSYLRVLDDESQSIITRLRRHASLVMWCGGNELFNAWSGMTDQDLALRLLNRNCYDLDPHRPFLMTSPLMGMAHGSYVFRDPNGVESFQLFVGAGATAYTEFGCAGPSNLETIESIIPPDEMFPPRLGTAWETHHALGAWQGNTWLLPEVIEDYFGVSQNVAQIVERGQLMQNEGYKALFEEARRQKPTCAMALNWCLNEPWPTAANNSLINWPDKPKPALRHVAQSCRPTLASARIAKFCWREGELFNPELWLLNDAPIEYSKGRIEAFLQMGNDEHFLLGWDFARLENNVNLIGPQIRFVLPHAKSSQMKLVLRAPEHAEWNSEYTLIYVPHHVEADDARRLLNL